MAEYIPLHRLYEIKHIAESLVFRANMCLVGRVASVAERVYLKEHAHINILIDPTVKEGEVNLDIDTHFNLISGEEYISEVFQINITHNDILSDKKIAEIIHKRLLYKIGQVIFFSEAAKNPIKNPDMKYRHIFLNEFTEKLYQHRIINTEKARPRFTLTKLEDVAKTIVDEKLHNDIIPHIHHLLSSHIGDGEWH